MIEENKKKNDPTSLLYRKDFSKDVSVFVEKRVKKK